ncbi:nucleotide sugar dehydrogenase [Micromonospora sp. DT227]|uniref:nucleotide sugar dehydrogenase n=1 Tax=Micromonospora sp. DT227 TaxID=3393433 RepID=UPI003CF73D01
MRTCERLAVIGLGYVGLPLAREAALSGMSVLGFDVDQRRVDALRDGRSYVDDITDDDISAMLTAGFRVDTSPEILADADAVVVCVPTPLLPDRSPDLSAVLAAADAIAPRLRPGMLVVLESTTYPGTTEEVFAPRLEVSGLVAGRDFSLAYSPERIDPGNGRYGLRNTPKVVGGMTWKCAEHAAAMYGKVVDQVVHTRSPREAEMAKLLENTYRHVNIALINEIATYCRDMRVDVWDVVAAAATKPFGFESFRPGAGVGGHCIPIDPHYLLHAVRGAGGRLSIVEQAQAVNDRMPGFVADRVEEALRQAGRAIAGASIVVLGVTYKPDVSDVRDSPATAVVRTLRERGGSVRYHDPYVDSWSVGTTVEVADLDRDVTTADAVLLLQAHRTYDLDDLAGRARLFIDLHGRTRGASVVPL